MYFWLAGMYANEQIVVPRGPQRIGNKEAARGAALQRLRDLAAAEAELQRRETTLSRSGLRRKK
jgi:hypothetical protein